MSTIRHERIYQQIVTGQGEMAFLNALDEVLSTIRSVAIKNGATVDWSTLTINPGDVIEIRSGAGEIVGGYHEPLTVRVDTIWIEEDE